MAPVEHRHGPLRRWVQVLCFLVFLTLPFTNMLRFDLPHQSFHFAGIEVGISEFSILFFSLMFLLLLLVAGAIFYGRLYCGYLCPQMIFSDWSLGLQRWLRSAVQKRLKGARPALQAALARTLFLGLLGLGSVFLAFIFTAYFVPPADLIHRLARIDLLTAGGITGAVVTLLTFIDLALVRHGFCQTVCPYGYLQGMLTDRQTLLVAYLDPGGACIDCRKCVTVCEMGVDIRESPFQLGCTHCGDCVDACEDVLRRLGHPGLIQYAWGGTAKAAAPEPWYRRWGLRDAKRFLILAVCLCYLGALAFTLHGRKPVLIRVAADRSTLFNRLGDGRIENRVRLNLANRSHQAQSVKVWVEGLPAVDLDLASNPIPLAPGATLELIFGVRAPSFPGAQDVNPIRVMTQSSDQKKPEANEMSFIMPVPAT
jgi:cytochrome c oxidase accessory protein FixG